MRVVNGGQVLDGGRVVQSSPRRHVEIALESQG